SRIRKLKWPALATVGAALVIGGVSCRKEPVGKPPDVDYYTCTMHPSVKKQNPTDKCPICSMDLVPVKKKGAATAGHDHGQMKSGTEKEDAKSRGMSPEDPAKTMSGQGAKMEAEEPPGEFAVPVARLQQIGVTYAAIERRKFEQAIRAVGVVAY